MRLESQSFDLMLTKPFQAAFGQRFQDEKTFQELAAKIDPVEKFITGHLRGGQYLGGLDQPMMLDIMCLGFTERLYMLEGSVWHDKFEKLQIAQKWPETIAWI